RKAALSVMIFTCAAWLRSCGAVSAWRFIGFLDYVGCRYKAKSTQGKGKHIDLPGIHPYM
ncbi:MAG: hypothetical protein ACPGZS_03815, partial [Candidatus Puniceispirillaceae bacterium]